MPRLWEATEGGDVAVQFIDTLYIHTAEDTRNLFYHFVFSLMHEAQASLPVSSFMGILLGELK